MKNSLDAKRDRKHLVFDVIDILSEIPLNLVNYYSFALFTVLTRTGNTIKVKRVDTIKPDISAIAMGLNNSLLLMAKGINPIIAVIVLSSIGLNLLMDAFKQAFWIFIPLNSSFLI